MPWWLYPVSFAGAVLVLGWLILKANGRPPDRLRS
jgi:hypothetical protein